MSRSLSRFAWRAVAVALPLALGNACGSDTGVRHGTDASVDGASDGRADASADGHATDDASDASSSDGYAADAADGSSGCSDPADPNTSKLCLTFSPETIDFEADPDLDGRGKLVVELFSTDAPSSASQPFATYESAAGEVLSVTRLPEVVFNGLPETVYVRTRFIDTVDGPEPGVGLTYGMFVGGLAFELGIQPAPEPPARLRPIKLTKGKATAQDQPLKALRKFIASVTLKPGVEVAGDARGPLRIGAFAGRDALGTVFGGAQLACAALTSTPMQVTGFVYSFGSNASFDLWFSGQLDDYDTGSLIGPGSILSLDESYHVPANQKATLTATQYSFQAPSIEFNTVFPAASDSTNQTCLAPADAGSDGATDGGDAGSAADAARDADAGDGGKTSVDAETD